MDPFTIAVAALLSVLTVGGGFIFTRQENRIATLEARLESVASDAASKLQKLTAEHLSCREENASLKARVAELERLLGVGE